MAMASKKGEDIRRPRRWRHRHGVRAAAVIAALIGIAAGSIVYATRPATAKGDSSARPSAQRVSAASLGEGQVSSSFPWRIEKETNGAVRILFGPGVPRLPLGANVVRYAVSNELTASTAASQGAWICQPVEPGMVTLDLDANWLESDAGVACDNDRPGQMRMEWWFDRSSWSGWRDYSEHVFTSWTSDQGQGTPIGVPCGPGGTYNYRARVEVQVRDTGSFVLGTGDADGNGSGRYHCGTSPTG